MCESLTVALIGSFRQRYDDVLSSWHSFNDGGIYVTSPVGAPVTEESRVDLFVRFESDPLDWTDAGIQTLALHRILRATFVYVVAPDGYVGRTTCYEIGRVLQADRPLYFSEKPKDLPIEVPAAHVLPAESLVAVARRGGLKPMFEQDPSPNAAMERRLLSGDYIDE